MVCRTAASPVSHQQPPVRDRRLGLMKPPSEQKWSCGPAPVPRVEPPLAPSSASPSKSHCSQTTVFPSLFLLVGAALALPLGEFYRPSVAVCTHCGFSSCCAKLRLTTALVSNVPRPKHLGRGPSAAPATCAGSSLSHLLPLWALQAVDAI